MAEFVEKTMGSLSSFFTAGSFSNSKQSEKLPSLWSIDKASFVKKLKSTTSKREEESIISSYLKICEKKLLLPNVSEAEIEVCVQIAMICETLGFTVPFIYVHAIKLAQKGNLKQKHTGYVAAASLLKPSHELIILLTNTIQKDLESSNPAEVLLGLKAVCNLINEETVNNVLYLVQEKLKHENFQIRKTACYAMNHCLLITNSESSYKIAFPKIEKALSDSNFEVVSAAVPVLYNIIKNCREKYDYLIPSLIHLLNQILERHIPNNMIFQNIPAPWLQIQILKCFPLICSCSKDASSIFPVLKITLQRAEINHQLAYGIIAEVITTIIDLECDEEMIQYAVTASMKLLKSDNSNYKYMGIQAFTGLIQRTKPTLTPIQQEVIIECLNHSDETLKLKALELLYHLVNPSNSQVICNKMVEYMRVNKAKHRKKDLALQALSIANQYNSDSNWYLHIINSILLEVGDFLPPEKISEILDVINRDASGNLKRTGKMVYLDLCQKSCPPNSMVKIISLVFDTSEDFEVILPHLDAMDIRATMWILIALRNIILKTKKKPRDAIKFLKNKKFLSHDVQQISSELLNLLNENENIEKIELTEKMDVTLSYLDEFVCTALLNGSPCYKPPRLRLNDISEKNFERVTSEVSSISWDDEMEKKNMSSLSSSSLLAQSQFSTNELLPDTFEVKRLWTKEGRSKDEFGQHSSAFKQISNEKENEETLKEIFAGVS